MLRFSAWSYLKASMSRSTFWASPWTRMWFWNFLRASSNSMPWKSISSTTQLAHKGTDRAKWMKPICSRLTGLSWPRFYHGGYVSIYKRGCYEGFLVTFVPWVILITWRIFMSWVCRSFVLCCFLFIKLLIAMAPPMFWYKLSFFVVVHADKDPLTFIQLYKA